MAKVEWDYSERAAHYDKRADYSADAISAALLKIGLSAPATIADIGAGTGKLSRPLGQRGFTVKAVEPNDEMRKFGIKNTVGLPVIWSEGTGENTGLPSASVVATFFGSSFNVVDQQKTLKECARILRPAGWFCCMWNHRDLDDPLQSMMEGIIKKHIQHYDYGKRRENPAAEIQKSGLFREVEHVEGNFKIEMSRADVVEAWKSHATLARQAGKLFDTIIAEINGALSDRSVIKVPYTTRIWFARLSGTLAT